MTNEEINKLYAEIRELKKERSLLRKTVTLREQEINKLKTQYKKLLKELDDEIAKTFSAKHAQKSYIENRGDS